MNPKMFAAIASACFVLMTAAYLLYLAATWNQLQLDRVNRDKKIDEMLSRIPKKTEVSTEEEK